jgi:hypothetical protein
MFDPTVYGEAVARVLAQDGSDEAVALLNRSKLPDLVRAGLYLHFGFWKEAHELVDDLETPDGMYWHAIVHRQEPDPANAGYWFRRVGQHPLFPALRARAVEIGVEVGDRWDPIAFVDYYERARVKPGSDAERKARDVQRAEWELLFDHCARPRP